MTTKSRSARRMPFSPLVLAAAIALGHSTSAQALQEVLAVTEEATITDLITAESRILLRFPSVSHLEDEWITRATLHVPLAGAFPAPLAILVDVPQSPWSSGASWSSPWSVPGGDPHDEQAVLRHVGRGSAAGVSVDVTYLVRSMQGGEIPENGFLLWPLNPDRMGFSSAELAAFGSRFLSTLEVSYRKLSALGAASP